MSNIQFSMSVSYSTAVCGLIIVLVHSELYWWGGGGKPMVKRDSRGVGYRSRPTLFFASSKAAILPGSILTGQFPTRESVRRERQKCGGRWKKNAVRYCTKKGLHRCRSCYSRVIAQWSAGQAADENYDHRWWKVVVSSAGQWSSAGGSDNPGGRICDWSGGRWESRNNLMISCEAYALVSFRCLGEMSLSLSRQRDRSSRALISSRIIIKQFKTWGKLHYIVWRSKCSVSRNCCSLLIIIE